MLGESSPHRGIIFKFLEPWIRYMTDDVPKCVCDSYCCLFILKSIVVFKILVFVLLWYLVLQASDLIINSILQVHFRFGFTSFSNIIYQHIITDNIYFLWYIFWWFVFYFLTLHIYGWFTISISIGFSGSGVLFSCIEYHTGHKPEIYLCMYAWMYIFILQLKI